MTNFQGGLGTQVRGGRDEESRFYGFWSNGKGAREGSVRSMVEIVKRYFDI